MNKGEIEPVYQRTEEFLYVIVGQPKYLYIYNLFTVSHNSLVSRLKLDSKYSTFNNYLFIENEKASSSIFLFIFYGSSKYEIINLEPNNILKGDPSTFADLFLTSENIENANYPQKIVNLSLSLIYPQNYPHNKSDPMVLSLNCSNKGLIIESKFNKGIVENTHSEGDVTFSLLEYFDGFNMTYNYQLNNGTNQDLNISISEDVLNVNLLESQTDNNWVKFAFVYQEIFLLTFYDNKDIIEVSSLI